MLSWGWIRGLQEVILLIVHSLAFIETDPPVVVHSASLSFSSQTPIIRICDPQSRVNILQGNPFDSWKLSFLPQDQFSKLPKYDTFLGKKMHKNIIPEFPEKNYYFFIRFSKIIYSPMIPVDAGDTWAAGSGIGPDSKWSCWMWPQSIKREHQACVTPGQAPGILTEDILTVSGKHRIKDSWWQLFSLPCPANHPQDRDSFEATVLYSMLSIWL